MAKNYMPEVAEMLGVEMNEEFEIKETLTKSVYKLTTSGLLGKCGDNDWKHANFAIVMLLIGEYHIVKLPWQPKYGEKYYKPSEKFSCAVAMFWHNRPWDFAYKEVGMVFRTKEELEAALPELRKKYLGGDCNEADN